MTDNDFRNYAVRHLGMNGLALDQYRDFTSRAASPIASYINPTIIEERQLNVAQMDVFSRLMMDRVIFLGTEVNDYTANVIQAQMLYLDSTDPGKDISIYINSPGGSVYAGLGIYDTMQYVASDVSTLCTGMAASMAAVLLVSGQKGKRFALRHSRVMIHQPMGGARGQASDIEITAREIKNSKTNSTTSSPSTRARLSKGRARLRPRLLDDIAGSSRLRHDRPYSRKAKIKIQGFI